MNQTSNDYLINSEEAAKLARTSIPTIHQWTRRADFDALLQVGRRKLIIRHKFIAWLERAAENKTMLK
ncbi:helix-turn-helix domain-containing protein [Christensenellaceae bacterium OttesenSCG-928-L17]|nr:helix-turn-helix domain-containing protein [Christensenellaceae bacterium OttesenSCG-928-L17]